MTDGDATTHLAVTLRGPLWSAQGTLLTFADPRENRSFRTLFVEATARGVGGQGGLLMPGTMLAACAISAVSLRPGGEHGAAYEWRRAADTAPRGPLDAGALAPLLRRGDVALLLVGAGPAAWTPPAGGELPELVCLAGDISLDVLSPVADATERLYRALAVRPADPGDRSGPARLIASLSVHASGLSLYGETELPWRRAAIRAPFQLAPAVATDAASPAAGAGCRLTVEAERLTGDERAELLDAWLQLSRLVNPSDPRLPDPVAVDRCPAWVTLEITDPGQVPRPAWVIPEWQERPAARPELQFERGEIVLLISDQQPHDQASPPRSLARAVPERVTLARDGPDLSIGVEIGPARGSDGAAMRYEARRANGGAWQERWRLSAAPLAFDAVETARFLRERQRVPAPDWSGREPIDEPVLWAFAPLHDGWAQLPVPNLTERIYLDAEAVDPAARAAPPVIEGAVSFGNDGSDGAGIAEQPWSVTLTNTRSVRGSWRVAMDVAADSGTLVDVTVTLGMPQLIVSGLLWLGTGAPTAQDALPAHDWVDGARSVALRTPGAAPYPPFALCPLESLELSLRRTAPGERPTAELGDWLLHYAADAALLERLVDANALPPDAFGRLRPLVWRRHPTLPMVQALPLTQALTPPNRPVPSRQLVPFELPIVDHPDRGAALALPGDWRFGATGAAEWPSLRSSAPPAREWAAHHDLALLSLTVPGLVLEPPGDADAPPDADGTAALVARYRLDLPATDELNALAQLPPPDGAGQATPVASNGAVRPLTRPCLHEHFAQLAERAALAAADAIEAFAATEPRAQVRALVEPLTWEITPALQLDRYPGALRLSNAADDPAELRLEAEAALRGISGRFISDDGTLRRCDDDADAPASALRIEAGSMAAHRTDAGTYLDQRGLARGATDQAGGLLRTPVTRRDEEESIALTSTLTPQALDVPAAGGGRTTWRLWFRDLPVRADAFDRATCHSARVEDVNDPEALARDHNHLLGYEWRLDPGASGRLELFGLHAHPLTLERASFAGGRLDGVEITARLTLPVAGGEPGTELTGAVRVSFRASAPELPLSLSAISLDTDEGQWPLAAAGADGGEPPAIRFGALALGERADTLELRDAELRLVLFDAAWTIPLATLSFDPTGTPIDHVWSATPADRRQSPPPLELHEVAVTLDPGSGAHTVSAVVALRLGADMQTRTTLRANVRLFVLGPRAGQVTCESAILFDDMALVCSEGDAAAVEATYTRGALQLAWRRHTAPLADSPDALQLLAGMAIASAEAPGAAAVTFTVVADGADAPRLVLESGFVEALVSCAWGEPLQGERVLPARRSAAVFGSSAGQVVLGYSATARGGTWEEALLVNGEIEVTDLVSWPLAAEYDAQAGTLSVPAARPVAPSRFYDALLELPDLRALWRWDEASGASVRDHVGEAHMTLSGNVVRGAASLIDSEDEHAATVLGAGAFASAGDVHSLTGRAPFTWGVLFTPSVVDGQARRLLAKLGPAPPHGYEWYHDRTGVTFTRQAGGAERVVDTAPLATSRAELLIVTYDGTRLRLYRNGLKTAEAPSSRSLHDTRAVLRWGTRSDGSDGAPGTYQASFLVGRALSGAEISALQAARPAGPPLPPPALDHVRHTIRVLLNQHELPGDCLAAGSGRVLFTLAPGRSWQFPAVVEQQLIDIQLPPAPAAPELARDRRWTAIQEVRLHSPGGFKRFLSDTATLRVPDPAADAGHSPLGDALDGYLGADLRDRLAHGGDAALDHLPADTLIVEASALHWVHQSPLGRLAAATTLQFLPQGPQVAQLATLEDLPPSDPGDPAWLLISTPFLGRLQAPADDGLDATAEAGAADGLQIDPVLQIQRRRAAGRAALPQLALGLATWREATAMKLAVSDLDAAVGRTWARLDPHSVEVNWLRLQRPAADSPAGGLRSVLASFPETPARLSRPRVLQRAWDAALGKDGAATPAVPSGPGPVWRESSLLAPQAVTRPASPKRAPLAWHMRALQLLSSRLLAGDRAEPEAVQRFAAATGLPLSGPPRNDPVVLAVSPYLTFDLRPVGDAVGLRLVFVELLCLDPSVGEQRPIAAQTYEPGAADTPETIRANSADWAREMHRRLSPESPTALLRFRELHEHAGLGDGSPPLLVTRYWFAVVADLHLPERLPRRTFALRSAPSALREREGQYGGDRLPAATRALELAPPQVTGVQPLYLAERPPGAKERWAWGFSGLRVALRYGADEHGAIGRAGSRANDATAPVLWWQVLQHTLQYRSAASGRPTGGLPPLFRAPAIKSLLPVLAAPPLPRLDWTLLAEDGGEPLARWQPVLPGALAYVLVGARPGAPYALRHSLVRVAVGSAADDALVSGSVPVQHRPPRPVPLPANSPPPGRRIVALLDEDEAWIAETGTAPTWDNDNPKAGASSLSIAHPGPGTTVVKLTRALDVGRLHSAAGDLQLWLRASDWTNVSDATYIELRTDASNYATATLATIAPGTTAKPASGSDWWHYRVNLVQLTATGSPSWSTITELRIGYVTTGAATASFDDWTIGGPDRRDYALQTWVGHFDPTRCALITDAPADEAFFARCGEEPACGLRIRLTHPSHGLLTAQWDGRLGFELATQDDPDTTTSWDLHVEIAGDGGPTEYRRLEDPSTPLTAWFAPEKGTDIDVLRQRLTGRPAGAAVLVTVRAKPAGHPQATGGDRFHQVLSFTLRVGAERLPPLPLEPRFAQFEDPEYNRRLASPPAQATRLIAMQQGDGTVVRSATLAADRREYNPASRLALRYDWDSLPEHVTGAIRLRTIDAGGIPRRVEPANAEARALLNPLPAGALAQIALDQLRYVEGGQPAALQPGQTLQLELALELLQPHQLALASVFLSVEIVERPVTPVPEAAYALLRRTWQLRGDEVECVRFAWSPAPDRIELICADDLRGDIVRRRALFRWSDSPRRGTSAAYAVQKIAAGGATHVPHVFLTPGDAT